MSNTVSWTYEDFWSFWMIDWEFLVPEWYSANAKSWDEVEAILSEEGESCYTIIWLVEEINTKSLNIISWVFKQVNPDYWFVDCPGKSKWIYIDWNNSNGALTWDEVEIIINTTWKYQIYHRD